MRISADTYLSQVNRSNEIRSSFRRICLTLSLVVVLGVFWGLKLTGITMAGEAFCGMEEHIHSEDCTARVLICETEESAGHTHTEDCLSRQLCCELPEQEGHIHSEECMERPLICELAEEEPHSHDESCYVQEMGCGLEESEEHTHDESCLVLQLVCELPETPGHIHEESCYGEEAVPVCGAEEIEAHFHTEECYLVEEDCYSCGLEESEGHSHTDECFEILEHCTLEEHIHTANCYSDYSADLETKDDWDASVADVIQGPSTAENILMVARSQLGAAESSRNFYVDEFGVRRGISRYGQWYGNPYGDWSAMFVSFCLDYAGVEGIPINAGPEAMRLAWEQGGLYAPAAEQEPQAGQILFLDKDGNGAADAVAIITGQKENVLFAVEGDIAEQVTQIGSVMLYAQEPEASPDEPAVEETSEAPPDATEPEEIPEEPPEETEAEEFPEEPPEEAAAEETSEAPPEEAAAEETSEAPPEEAAAEETSEAPPEEAATEEAPEEPPEETEAEEFPEEIPEEPELPADRVLETLYSADDPAVMGYGLVPFKRGLMLAATPRAAERTIWLDGTNGGIMSLGGAGHRSYTAEEGTTFTLPDTWQSPEKYEYVLRGWYDVTNNKYYPPGGEVTVTGNMVFYADWAAATYDIGQFNSQVADTVSTNDFVTVRMFDYGVLFNVLSERANVSYNNGTHTETWNLITNGNNPYNGAPTLNYIFRDWDRGNEDISYPNGTNDRNNPTSAGSVYPGLYTDTIRDLLFDPDSQTIGVQYLGEGDHLFQFCDDPNDPHYGYYYYNSERNAASYNQTDQRFYVYEYLECTRTSSGNQTEGKLSDFLPLNSPYANTNGNIVTTYSYGGVGGEYNGTTHYMYDCRYDTDGNRVDYVGTNFWFGMSAEIEFYLPNVPGATVSGGGYGNQDLYGKDMHFQFTGDDDVWILIDGKMVLDLGGIHGMESGDINFATGVVTVNGVVNQQLSNNLKSIGAGEHTLSLYYLERGSSMGNCAMYFNLAPRFSFSIQKEDVLSRELLNGAQFSVYLDEECTIPAELWSSKASHDSGAAATNVFTVRNGTANMWGMGAGNTYYIKETRKPDAEGYDLPAGIIELDFDMLGFITYKVHVIEEDGVLTPGFTVHGIQIDEERQSAFIVATNIPEVPGQESTAVSVRKRWEDKLDHSGDAVTVFLTVTEPDGTVRRIREIELSKKIDWTYTWENLPKLDAQGNEIIYGIQEALVPGYVGKVEEVEDWDSGGGDSGSGDYVAAGSFENGETYLLSTTYGYLATKDLGICLYDSLESAANQNDMLWSATVNNDGTVTLVSKSGKTLYYNNYTFHASSSPGQYRNLRFANNRLYCYIDHGGWQETQYPVDDSNVPNNTIHNHVLYTTNNRDQALVITPQKLTVSEPEPPPPTEGTGLFQITNTPVGEAVTSLTVRKAWNTGGYGGASLYETLSVELNLLVNGADSGLSGVVNLKNGWTYTFRNLPLYDSSGQQISYSVAEENIPEEWQVSYGEITAFNGAYSTTVTNTYYIGGPELPSTGTSARMLYILCGGSMMLSSLVYGILSRRRRERRTE